MPYCLGRDFHPWIVPQAAGNWICRCTVHTESLQLRRQLQLPHS